MTDILKVKIDGQWVGIPAITGPKGAQGEQGLKGDTGSQGPKGDKGEQGTKGEQGIQGLKGDTGQGIASGGAAGQVLAKNSAADYDTAWESLTAADIGAASAVHSHSQYLTTESDPTVPAWAKAAQKPTYTAAEVGAASSVHSHTKSQITDFPTSMTPTAHAATHATGGSDAITPASIGAEVAGAVSSHNTNASAHSSLLAGKIDTSLIGAALGIAPLGTDAKVPLDNLPEDIGGGQINYTIQAKEPTRTTLTPLSTGRSGLAAATDGNGNVLFGGGSSNGYIAAVDKYTPDGVRTTLPSLSEARSNLAAATGGNGSVLFGGGGDINSAAVDKYTPDGVRTTLTPLSAGRGYLAAATDGNGNVLFGGGMSKNSGSNSSSRSAVVDKYTPDGVRTTLTPLYEARGYLAAATDGNGNVLFGGGSGNIAAVDKYTPDGVRTTLTPLYEAGYRLAAATDGNGNVLFGGGSSGSTAVAAVDKYTPDGVCTTLTPLSAARQDLAAATDGNGDVLFGGGYSNGYSAAVDKYTPDGVRTTLTPLSAARGYLAAATDGNGNVLFGGSASSGNSAVVDKYILTIDLPVLIGYKYKFREHGTEQTAYNTTITVLTPNTGYIKMSGSVTI